MDVPFWAWAAVLAVIVAMLAIDLFAHRTAHVVGVKEAAAWSAAWVSLGIAFGGVIWWAYGAQAGGEYYAGYLIEKSLAVDNVFVFALIFTYFAVPREYQHRVLFYGVLGALVFRAIFIAGGAVLIENFAWILYLFGAFLVYTGWKMFTHRNDEMDLSSNPVLRWVKKRVPSTEECHGQKFWVRKAGKWVATPLFFVLVMVETTDIIFAVDSIPAIFAVTQDPFLVFTSNAFAILGLRAMYFLLADLIDRFIYLKAGLAAILVFVGIKMLLLDVYKMPIWLSLSVITACLTVAVVASLRATRDLVAPRPAESKEPSESSPLTSRRPAGLATGEGVDTSEGTTESDETKAAAR
ncbi:tellurium resistance protein TerC [Nocardioides szechwanensis]|uniref:Tellurite resistance protein TerC n=1 Tax=Nocardioides szechwanensis TaxID=1005944 RepID=A0A1H0J9T8_9ACTN|nr:TerC family protein [Nocardioides szechwanensis]GEP35057.1 tellurium resistance protein TerC [Nocardioides szechwanensis]SDO40414.1 tellurite resistance protein TerC [Nocardioides szechwanensis]